MNRIANRWSLLAVVSIAGAAAASACGGGGTEGSLFVDPIDGGSSVTEGGSPPFPDPLTDGAPHTLAISPADATLDVTSPGVTLAFTALLDGAPTRDVAWNLDTAVAGAIDAAGVFTANGNAGGLVNVYAETSAHVKAQTTLTVRLHASDNPGGVDAATQAALKAGGSADGAFAWLYPYDATVFPRGLLPPVLQFAGAGASAFYVKVTSKAFTYEGFYAGSDPLRIEWSPALWRAITLTAMQKDPVKVEVTKGSAVSGGGLAVTGPVTESWTIAQGSLKGIVYYNTYDSPIAAGDAGLGHDEQGAVMRIRPSASQPEVFLGGAARGSCTVCHTISANGTTVSASAGHQYDGIWTIDADASAPTGPISQRPDNAYSFGALTPDGRYLLSSGARGLDGGPGTEAGAPPGDGEFGPNNVSMTREQDSVLYDTASGNVVVAQILGGAVKKALMPAFSPDGKRVAFMDYGATQGTGLSVMDFDEATHTLSNLSLVVSDPDVFFGWPSFLPDGKQFVYQVGDRDDYATWRGGSGELLIADIASKDATKLRMLNGVKNGQSYLQHSGEEYLNYQPTVLPVAEGGYYWVVFTSRRMYGNVITEPDETEGVRKKLWIAALDVNAPSGTDPSHPAFYLPGQELASGNLRAFWALEPCRQTGTTCESGSECCTGFCRQVSADAGPPAFACIAPPPSCSQEDERCTVASDCCEGGYLCINNRCARPTPR